MGGGAPSSQPEHKTTAATTFQGQQGYSHHSHPLHSAAAATPSSAAASKRRAIRRRGANICRTTTIYADLASERESPPPSSTSSHSSWCCPPQSSSTAPSSSSSSTRLGTTAISPPRPSPPLATAPAAASASCESSLSASPIPSGSPSRDPPSSSPSRHQLSPAAMDPTIPNGLPPHAIPYSPSAAVPPQPQPASYPSSYTKFNTALNAGLLNPMSPPPPPPSAIRSSPTLFEMMANEQDAASAHYVTNPTGQHYPSAGRHQHQHQQHHHHHHHAGSGLSLQERQLLLQERVAEIVGSSCSYCCGGGIGAGASPSRFATATANGNGTGSMFLHLNDPDTCDVRLTLTSRDHDAISATVDAHRVVLAASSRFFASRLVPHSDHARGNRHASAAHPTLVDISDCDDVEAYAETLRLMYCGDPRRRLMRDVVDVPRVLALLRVSAALGFDKGVAACLECLEAAPWGEDEEEKVAGVLGQLRLLDSDGTAVGEVLKRLVPVPTAGPVTAPPLPCSPSSASPATENDSGVYQATAAAATSEEILLRLLQVVLEGKDEKARREMKALVSKMLRENHAQQSTASASTTSKHPETTTSADISRDSLYSACDTCLTQLRRHFSLAASGDLTEASQIARQADNLHWLLDILIDRRAADGFLRCWAAETDLAASHPRVPAVHRHEISRVTARLLVGVGKGQILVPKESRCQLLSTWLEPLYEDFGWMRRACKGGMDRHSVEDGLANTVLTLPLGMQQEIFLAWFDRFLNSGDDCPNIQRGFEVWWRRAFWRRHGEPERPPTAVLQQQTSQQMLRITAAATNLDENP